MNVTSAPGNALIIFHTEGSKFPTKKVVTVCAKRLQCRAYILPKRKLTEHIFECGLHRCERAGYRGCGLLGRRTRNIQLSLYYMNSGVNVAQIIDVVFYSGDFLCVSQQALHFSFCAAIPELEVV